MDENAEPIVNKTFIMTNIATESRSTQRTVYTFGLLEEHVYFHLQKN